MKAAEILRENLNALMRLRGWTSNKPVIDASGSRLSNGTLGRLRAEPAENVKLNVVDEIADVFGVPPHLLLQHHLGEGGPAVDPLDLRVALARLGAALGQEMPDDVRQDAADLLHKLAMRSGAERHQEELAHLLDLGPVILTTEARGHALAITDERVRNQPQNPSAVAISSDDTQEDSWIKRFKKTAGTGPLKGAGVTTKMSGQEKKRGSK